jgi:hypothetical protein
MPYAEIYPPDEEAYHPLAVGYNMFLETVDRRRAQVILDHLKASTAMMAVTQLRVMGGAVARVPDEATAYAHRKSRIMANLAALYGQPDEKRIHQEWLTGYAAAMQQGDRGVYVNFLGDEGQARVRAAYPGATWDRLAAIKRRYDPTNLFRLNQNIAPAGTDGNGGR